MTLFSPWVSRMSGSEAEHSEILTNHLAQRNSGWQGSKQRWVGTATWCGSRNCACLPPIGVSLTMGFLQISDFRKIEQSKPAVTELRPIRKYKKAP